MDKEIFRRRFIAKGRIVNESEQPVMGARIVLVAQRKSRVITSDRRGQFTVTGLPKGRHPVRVMREGYFPSDGALNVPQRDEVVIRLKRQGNCRVFISLIQLKNGNRIPFTGVAQLTILTSMGRRIESMEGGSRAELLLPHGSVTIDINSPEVQSIKPSHVSLKLQPGEQRTIEVIVETDNVLTNEEVQLLAVICRRVPPCPEN